MTKYTEQSDAPETIYCANYPCETEAMYCTELGTPLCATCHEAYLLGQGSPDAFTYEIDELANYHAYCGRWAGLHGEKLEIWNGREIVKRLNFGYFVNLMEECDDLASMAENDQIFWPPEQQDLVNKRLPELRRRLLL